MYVSAKTPLSIVSLLEDPCSNTGPQSLLLISAEAQELAVNKCTSPRLTSLVVAIVSASPSSYLKVPSASTLTRRSVRSFRQLHPTGRISVGLTRFSSDNQRSGLREVGFPRKYRGCGCVQERFRDRTIRFSRRDAGVCVCSCVYVCVCVRGLARCYRRSAVNATNVCSVVKSYPAARRAIRERSLALSVSRSVCRADFLNYELAQWPSTCRQLYTDHSAVAFRYNRQTCERGV